MSKHLKQCTSVHVSNVCVRFNLAPYIILQPLLSGKGDVRKLFCCVRSAKFITYWMLLQRTVFKFCMDFCHLKAEQCNVGDQPGHLCPEVHEDDSHKEMTSSLVPVQICSMLGMKSFPFI